MLGISHLRLPVTQLERSRTFYSHAMGFEILPIEKAGTVTLDALGIRLCLFVSEPEIRPLELAFQTARIQAAVDRLTAGGAVQEEPPHKTLQRTLETILRDPDGHRLCLWRRLREDEYPQEPDLPITRAWDVDARDLLKDFLRKTPVLFRDVARKGCVREAEFLTPSGACVDRRTVARAVIRATPRMLRFRVRGPLTEMGFDLDDFSEDFSI